MTGKVLSRVDDPTGVEDWRARAEQLQNALDSRIVLEQAKGMLRERLSLSLDLAFELLRLAARSSRRRLHDLAEEVVSSFSTPDALIQALARSPEKFLTTTRETRLVQTEELYRRVNDALAQRTTTDEAAFLCECSSPYCSEMIELAKDDVEVLHSLPGYYVVAPGHDIPDVEEVVQETERYLIVKKTTLA